jgi:hypothetical protein
MTKKRPSQSACLILAILPLAGCLGYRTPMLHSNGEGNTATPLSKDAGTDLPGKDLASDLPGKDLASDLPGKDLASDLPGKDLAFDLPGKDLASDPLGKDLAADLPGKDLATDLPRSDARTDSAPDLSRPDLAPDLVRADVSPLANCAPGDPYILVLGADNTLYRFDPSTLTIAALGSVACGSDGLNSMTASTIGPAYISNQSGELCIVDLKTFQTSLTAFDPSVISGDPTSSSSKAFGMALLSDSVPAGQTLYIAAKDTAYTNRLSRIDLATFQLSDVGPILPVVPSAELTAGPSGELYGFSIGTSSSLLLNIDPQTGSSIDVTTVPKGKGASGSSFALVYWQGDFYLFLAPITSVGASNAEVFRYHKGATEVESIGTLGVGIIGAGVAACQ